jgi:hypothetical protein
LKKQHKKANGGKKKNMEPKKIKRRVDAYGCVNYNLNSYYVGIELALKEVQLIDNNGRLTAILKDGTKKRLSKNKGKAKTKILIYKTPRDENGRLTFAAIHGATEGFTSVTLLGLKALRDKIAETTCKEDAIVLVNNFIIGYTESQNSFLGRVFSKRKNSASDKGDKP